jgi:ATP-dependent helicase HrpA
MALGLRRLFVLENSDVRRLLSRKLPRFDSISMLFAAVGTRERLHDQLVAAVLAKVIPDDLSLEIRDRDAFREASASARQNIGQVVAQMCALVMEVMEQRMAIVKQIDMLPDYHPLRDDAAQSLGRLLPADFIAQTPVAWLVHFPRYLRALAYRLDGGGYDASRDAARQAIFNAWWQRYLSLTMAQQDGPQSQQTQSFRWMLEEFAVSLFAQHLGTHIPVSEKRLSRAWDVMQHSPN